MARERVRALDGVRGLAILCVLFGHATALLTGRWRVPSWSPLPYGGFGVLVFFVLSGFLITSGLTAERLSLREFYRRRAYRILPPYYVMLAVAALLAAAGVVSIPWARWLSAAVFGWNYSPYAGGWVLSHTWSLAVEEQFYLLWPVLLVWLGRRRAPAALVAFAVAAPLLRVLTYVEVPAWRGHVNVMFHTRGDALAIGCLLALAWRDPRTVPFCERLFARRVHWLALAYLPVTWYLARRFQTVGWRYPAGYSLDALAIALLMAYALLHPPRWLTSRALVHVGLVSYSLYLWQQWLLVPGSRLPVPLALAFAFLLAEVSYRLVERPALALRQRSASARNVRSCLRIITKSPATSIVDIARPSGVRGYRTSSLASSREPAP